MIIFTIRFWCNQLHLFTPMPGLRKFKKISFTLFVILALCFAITVKSEARHTNTNVISAFLTQQQDTTPVKRSTAAAVDSANRNDTIPTSQRVDTFSLKLSKDTLEGPVNYEADSAVLHIQDKKILMYGQTKTTYKDIVLTAPKVALDQQTSTVLAVADRDSIGEVITRAQFEQGTNNFESDTIRYNFRSQKGLTRNTFTQQSEMFVQGEKIKRVDQNTFFVSRGRFTTCNLDQPHFAFRTNKLKVINGKLAVSGPTHPEFEDVPLPFYLPFGFFPLSQGRHSGFLPPQFTNNDQFGVGLEGLGYYKVLNDNVDVTLRGNLYSYGGWNAYVTSSYRTRYRYNGVFNFSLQHSKFNFKGDPDYQLSKTFQINWNHAVDQRARPGTNFSANVNAGSTRFNEFIPNNVNRNFQNNLASSISYAKTWAGRPYNLTLSANHGQNSVSRQTNIVLPDGSFTVQTLYPLQRKEALGTPKWYEKLGIGYNGIFRNQLSFSDTAEIRLKDLIDTLQWGAQHNLPITLSLPSLGPLLVAPSISYREVWLQQKSRFVWNNIDEKVDTTIQKGFYTDREVSFGIGLNTSVFGTYSFKNSRLIALRHTVRPTFSLNYRPDLSRKHWYKTKVNKNGDSLSFNEFQGSLFQGFSAGRFGGISFGVDNNLEMKMRSKKDTGDAAIKKVRLIDGFGFNSGYNFLQDTLQLSPFNLYLRSTLFERINLNMSGLLNPYKLNNLGRPVNQFAWQGGRFSPGQLSYASVALSTSFQSKKKDEKGNKVDVDKNAGRIPVETDPTLMGDQQHLLDYMRRNPAEFVDFTIPWSINLSFSMNYARRIKPDYSGFQSDITTNLSFNNSFSLTPKWNFSTSGYYDVSTMQLQTFTMSISRDMHCWQMSINVTPIGPFRFFSLNINPKSGMLQDLKVNRTRYFYNY
ncbi:MAG TPA: putative LPS assembly protein LptD [Chitinophagaceae bacterium]|nr:putative LPS assembly protein LptD [Chitinophagaceae bacterium]